MKLRLLTEGVAPTPAAIEHMVAATERRKLTPADFASTTGLILRLESSEWVNAPVVDHNANFVRDPGCVLDLREGALVVRWDALEFAAEYWVPPNYHDRSDPVGNPWNWSAVTHGDRVRLSPMQGCAMVCKFCNIPYEDRYGMKSKAILIGALQTALADPVQPARHVLISGGTPKPGEFGYLSEVYEEVLTVFSGVQIDIMMAPTGDLLDFDQLRRWGVYQLSLNLEVFNLEAARVLMRYKWRDGRQMYLDQIGRAAEALGRGRVRSMLMVGLEAVEDTLRGVRAIAERGAVPVLSPFRPDPATPLCQRPPPSVEMLEEVYLRAEEIVADFGGELGPSCTPCTHNTLTFVSRRREADGDSFELRLV